MTDVVRDISYTRAWGEGETEHHFLSRFPTLRPLVLLVRALYNENK
jgi:hypothetical protein